MTRQVLDNDADLQRRAWLRAVLAGTAGFTLMSLFGGSSCHWDDDDCWDDDDDCDDDDFGSATLAEDVPSYRLEEFDLVTSPAGGRAHPVAGLTDIRGLSIGMWTGSSELGEHEFAEFTARILEHNEGLIGLPASAGRLVLASVDFGPDSTVVRYQQLRDEAGSPVAVPGAELSFRFDLIGNLLSIENSTIL